MGLPPAYGFSTHFVARYKCALPSCKNFGKQEVRLSVEEFQWVDEACSLQTYRWRDLDGVFIDKGARNPVVIMLELMLGVERLFKVKLRQKTVEGGKKFTEIPLYHLRENMEEGGELMLELWRKASGGDR